VKYSLLNRVHPDARLDALRRHQDLFEGGDTFRARVAEYLLQNDVEPASVFRLRCKRAHYLNYCARIVRWFAAALFASPPSLRSEPTADDWYTSSLKEDADGAGTDLDVVLRDAFTRALVGGRAYVRIEAPDPGDAAPASLADADRMGLRNMRVCAVPTESVRNWRRNRDGSFAWVLEHERREELPDLEDDAPTITETWTQWYADGSARRWQLAYTASNKPNVDTSVPEADPPANPTGVIPLVELRLPAELHLLAHIADAQLEHFRKRNALSWAVDRNCYAMPVFHLKDARKPPPMGTGYFLMLGVDEKLEWPAPPSAPFEVVASMTRELVQEIHRVVEQMALAVDNNAAAAVGRSADSKNADGRATQIVLPAFGVRVREFEEKILDLVSAARGDALAWSVEGMDHFEAVDAATIVESALGADPLRVPSPTHRRELLKSVSRAMLPHLREDLRAKIDAEIEAGVSAEDTRESTIPPPGNDNGEDDEKIPPPPKVPREARA
jgi:hypothetical protein